MKLDITKEWFEQKAAKEGDLEIGAGLPTYVPPFIPSEADRYYGRIITNMQAEIDTLKMGIKRLSDEEELCAETTGDDPFSLVYLASKLAAREAENDQMAGVIHDRLAELAAKDAEIAKLREALTRARAVAIDDVLAALVAHELYQYRPKAFKGFIEYAETLKDKANAQLWREGAGGSDAS